MRLVNSFLADTLIGLDKHQFYNFLCKIVSIFLPMIFSICFGIQESPPQFDLIHGLGVCKEHCA